MAKESLYTPQKSPVFREVFSDEQTTRLLGGVPTSVTYSNGVGTFNGSTSYVTYPKKYNGIYSIRLKFTSVTVVANTFLVDNRRSGGAGFLYFTNAGTPVLVGSEGTVYVDGVATGGAVSSANKELVISGITLKGYLDFMCDQYLTHQVTGSLDLIEIYDYTLTANEVANMANNKRYEALQYSSGVSEILNVDATNGVIANKYSGSVVNTELLSNGNPIVDSGWTKNSATISGGIATLTNTDAYIAVNAGQTTGKKYRVKYTIQSMSGVATFRVRVGYTGSGVSRTTIGTYIEDIVCDNTSGGLTYFIINGSGVVTISNLSLKEVVPDITNTSVTPVRSGNIWAMNFNGTTSKLDCGNYDRLVGDKTFIVWVKPNQLNGSNILLTNGRCTSSLEHSNGRIYLTRDNVTYAQTNPSTFKVGVWQQIIVTSTSTGVTNFYYQGALNSTASQAGGTPVAGIINMNWGSNLGTSRLQLSAPRIIDGILTAQEISQLFSNERRNYGV